MLPDSRGWEARRPRPHPSPRRRTPESASRGVKEEGSWGPPGRTRRRRTAGSRTAAPHRHLQNRPPPTRSPIAQPHPTASPRPAPPPPALPTPASPRPETRCWQHSLPGNMSAGRPRADMAAQSRRPRGGGSSQLAPKTAKQGVPGQLAWEQSSASAQLRLSCGAKPLLRPPAPLSPARGLPQPQRATPAPSPHLSGLSCSVCLVSPLFCSVGLHAHCHWRCPPCLVRRYRVVLVYSE
jgi:hypothetical protein